MLSGVPALLCARVVRTSPTTRGRHEGVTGMGYSSTHLEHGERALHPWQEGEVGYRKALSEEIRASSTIGRHGSCTRTRTSPARSERCRERHGQGTEYSRENNTEEAAARACASV
jgi:hypothetical protein